MLRESVKSRLEDYLTTIYRLEEVFGNAKITDISRELKVSPATVSKIMRKCEEKNLVKRRKYRYVELTNRGRKIAEQIIRKHRIVEVFLSSTLGFNELESHQFAHYLEHLPDVVIERIYVLIGKPGYCPHGNIIPGSNINISNNIICLTNANKDQKCIVKRISGEFIDVLKNLYRLGIKIGSTIRIIENTVDSVILELDNALHINIPNYFARFVFVEC